MVRARVAQDQSAPELEALVVVWAFYAFAGALHCVLLDTTTAAPLNSAAEAFTQILLRGVQPMLGRSTW